VAGGFVGVGAFSSAIQYSYDGLNWYNASISFITTERTTGKCESLSWNGNTFVAVGTADTEPNYSIQYSYDGIIWYPCESGGFVGNSSSYFKGLGINVSWNGLQWIAAGYGPQYSTVLYSYDGKNWLSPITSIDVGSFAYYRIGNNLNIYPTLQAGSLCIFANNQITNVSPFAYANQTIITTASTLSFNSTLFFDRSSFRVGVQTATPQFELDVRGDIEQTTAIALKPTAGEWLSLSDRRIKTNIQLANVDMCYSTVKAIDLYRYNFINGYNNSSDTTMLGFIAQNVQTQFPKAVHVINDRTYNDLLCLDISQIFMAQYGATEKLSQLTESNDVFLSSIIYPLISPTKSISNTLSNQSTQFITIHTETVSTLAGNQAQLQSLANTYETLISQLSSLLI
jgi:hypothetical protein